MISRSAFFLLYTFICLVWGSTWLVIRLGHEANIPPFVAASTRFVLASVILWIWTLTLKVKLPRGRSEWQVALLNGLLSGAASYSIVYWTSQYVPSGIEAVIFGSMPLWTILFGHYLFGLERITLRKLAGVLVGFIGITAIFIPTLRTSTTSGYAIGLMCLAPIVSAYSLLVVKKHGSKIAAVALNSVAVSVAASVFTLIAILRGEFTNFVVTPTVAASVLYLALFGTVFAFVTYYHLLRTREAVVMSYVAIITPVIAVILGAVLDNEEFSILTLTGSLLVVLGVWLAISQRPPMREVPHG